MGIENERDDDFEGFGQHDDEAPRLPDPPAADDDEDSGSPAHAGGDRDQAPADPETDDDGGRQGEPHRESRAKKRIQQLATQRNEAMQQLEDERRARQELEARLAKLEEQESSSLEARLKDIEARRKAAIEDGEIEQAITLGDELAELRMDLKLRPKKAAQSEDSPQQPAAPQAQRQPTAPNVPPATARWIERNSDWIHAQPAKLQLAARLESELIASGEYEQNTDDLYDALDEMLDQQMSGKPAPKTKPRTQSFASAGVPNEPGNQAGTRRQGRLTNEDVSRMRLFNLDPDIPAHRKAWLQRNEPV